MEIYILKLKDFGSVLETTYYKHREKVIRFGHSSEEEKSVALVAGPYLLLRKLYMLTNLITFLL